MRRRRLGEVGAARVSRNTVSSSKHEHHHSNIGLASNSTDGGRPRSVTAAPVTTHESRDISKRLYPVKETSQRLCEDLSWLWQMPSLCGQNCWLPVMTHSWGGWVNFLYPTKLNLSHKMHSLPTCSLFAETLPRPLHSLPDPPIC